MVVLVRVSSLQNGLLSSRVRIEEQKRDCICGLHVRVSWSTCGPFLESPDNYRAQTAVFVYVQDRVLQIK